MSQQPPFGPGASGPSWPGGAPGASAPDYWQEPTYPQLPPYAPYAPPPPSAATTIGGAAGRPAGFPSYGAPGPGAPALRPWPLARPDQRENLAVAGFVLGLLSLVPALGAFGLCFAGLPAAVLGIVFSAMAVSTPAPWRRGMAIVGLAAAILALVLPFFR